MVPFDVVDVSSGLVICQEAQSESLNALSCIPEVDENKIPDPGLALMYHRRTCWAASKRGWRGAKMNWSSL